MVTKNIKNVKSWKNGTMVQRWVSVALLDAERCAHRIRGYHSMGALIAEIKRLTVGSGIEYAEKESITA